MDFPSANPQVGIAAEVLEAFFEIVRSKTQISIKLHNEVPVMALKCFVPVIKRFHHTAAGLPETSICPVYRADPWQLVRDSIEDVTRSVGGSVIHDHPF